MKETERKRDYAPDHNCILSPPLLLFSSRSVNAGGSNVESTGSAEEGRKEELEMIGKRDVT